MLARAGRNSYLRFLFTYFRSSVLTAPTRVFGGQHLLGVSGDRSVWGSFLRLGRRAQPLLAVA